MQGLLTGRSYVNNPNLSQPPQSTVAMPALPLEIDVTSVKQLRDSGETFVLLDVRNPDEHATASIAGSTFIPMSELQARLAELEPHKQDRIIVHCHHGGRSLRVTHFLRQQGFAQVQNMDGGIDAWSLQVDPSVPRY
jgi:rhodanese-related sulfurtransferase